MGLIPFVAWEKCLKEDALIREPLSRQTSDSVFKFGNNGRLKALFAAEVPIWLYGKKAFLFVTIVAGQTPLLLSRHTLRSMHASIDFSAGVITSGQLGVDHEPIKEVGGHLVLDLMNTDSCPNVVAYMSDLHCPPVTDPNLNGSDDSNVVFHEDCWCWVSAAVFRRDHAVPRCCLFHPNDADEMNELDVDTWAPFCIQISRCEGRPTCEVTMFSWKSLTKSNSSSDSFWIGETWFWIESVNKREVFREILKHSSMGVVAPLLRSAWKSFFAPPSPDSYGSALPYVLEPGSDSLPLGEEGTRIHSQGQSRSTSGPSDSSAGVLIQASGEVDGHRTSSDLQVGGEGQTTSGRSNTILQHQAQGRADGDGQGPSDCDSPGAEGEQGRADADASSTLAWTSGDGSRDAFSGVSNVSNAGASNISTSGATCGTQVQECEERIQEGGQSRVGSGEPKCHVGRRSEDFEEGGRGREEGRGDPKGATGSSHQVGSGKAQGWYPFGCHGSQVKQRSLRKSDRAVLTDSLKSHAYVERDICSAYQQCHRKEVREQTTGTRKSLKVLEIFCGVMTLSIVAGSLGWSVMQPIDKELGRYGIDLSKPSEQKRVLDFIDREQPDLILLAPPCGDYSPLQNIMPKCPMKRWRKTQRLLWKRMKSKPLWKFTRKIMKARLDGSLKVRLVGVENPKNSAAWKLYDIPGYPAHIDQCRFRLRLFGGKRLVKKPTTIMCSDPEYASLLEAHCTCPKRFGRRHDHIKGSFRSPDGSWISHSSACGAWTRELCEHFLHCAECVLRPGHRDISANVAYSTPGSCMGDSADGAQQTKGLLGRAIDQIHFDVFALENVESNGNGRRRRRR